MSLSPISPYNRLLRMGRVNVRPALRNRQMAPSRSIARMFWAVSVLQVNDVRSSEHERLLASLSFRPRHSARTCRTSFSPFVPALVSLVSHFGFWIKRIVFLLVGSAGLEPAINGLKARCITNYAMNPFCDSPTRLRFLAQLAFLGSFTLGL